MNLSPEERARRAAHIRPHGAKGRAKAMLMLTREQRVANVRKAIAKRVENARRFKEIMNSDTIESFRSARRQLEAKAAKYRESLLKAAKQGENEPSERAVGAVTAALRDYRAEIAHLWARERALAKEQGDAGGTVREPQRGPGCLSRHTFRNACGRWIPRRRQWTEAGGEKPWKEPGL